MKKCPKCKSSNIQLYAGGELGSYQCTDCGYVGSLIIEEE
jgi:transposase-like protein